MEQSRKQSLSLSRRNLLLRPSRRLSRKGVPIDDYDPGNAYTRDLLYDKATNKQFHHH